MMTVYENINDLNDSIDDENLSLTIGNFDGVHLGHQQLISDVLKHCEKNNESLAIMTFTPHPRMVLRGDNGFLINEFPERRELLVNAGAGKIVELHFDRDFSNLTPEEFLEKFIFNIKNLKTIFLGHDFAFGANKSGSYDLVKQLASKKGIAVFLESEFSPGDGQQVSSTQVRNAILSSEMKLASQLLGREFQISGRVVKGQGRGKTIGFPTANLMVDPCRIIPKHGVYATQVTINNLVFNSITNVGVNPTFKDDKQAIVETFIFDFDQDIYGDVLKVKFFDFIRPEKKFNSVNELIAQITVDVEKSKKYFNHD